MSSLYYYTSIDGAAASFRKWGLINCVQVVQYNITIGFYIQGHKDPIDHFFLSGFNNYFQVLDDGKLTQRHVLRSHQKPVSFVAWSPDDTMLLTCGNIEVLNLWDVETGTCKHTYGDAGFIISSCAWFPDSKRFVCGSSDPEKGIYMWDCEGNEIRSWKGMRMPKVLDLAITADGEKLISIFSDRDIRILNVGTSAERVISEAHPLTSLSLSGDGKFFIVNLNSQEIHMWDIAGKWLSPLKFKGHRQHKYVIRSCFGGLDSTFIASGSEDSKVCSFINASIPAPRRPKKDNTPSVL